MERKIISIIALFIILALPVLSQERSFNVSELPLNQTIEVEIQLNQNESYQVIYDQYLTGPREIDLTSINSTNATNHTIQVILTIPETIPPGEYNQIISVNGANKTTNVSIPFSINDDTPFSIGVEEEVYEIGDSVFISITAPYNSTVNLTISNGNVTDSYLTEIYYKAALFYITQESGNYTVSADLQGAILDANFSVVQPLECTIPPISGRINQPIQLSANVNGGFPDYEYEWDVEGSTYSEENPEITFAQPGNYQVQLFATDEEGNEVQCSANIDIIQETFELTLEVRETEERYEVGDVLVEINGGSYRTNANGRAVISGLPEGTYTLELSREDFQSVSETVTIDSSITLELNMSEIVQENLFPEITNQAPSNDATIDGSSVTFRFSVSSRSDLTYCKLLVNQDDLLGYRVKDAIETPRTGSHELTVELQNGNYKWKVQCANTVGESSSEEQSLTITGVVPPEPTPPPEEIIAPPPLNAQNNPGNNQPSSSSNAISPPEPAQENTYHKRAVELNSLFLISKKRILEGTNDQKLAASIIKLENIFNELEKKLSKAMVDAKEIPTLALAEDFKKVKLNELDNTMDEIESELPINLFVLSKTSMVHEPTVDHILPLAQAFIPFKGEEFSERKIKRFASFSEDQQEKSEIFSQLLIIEVETQDKARTPFTIVQRKVTPSEDLIDASIVESWLYEMDFIEATFSEQVLQMNDNTIGLDLQDEKTYSYFIPKKVQLSDLKESPIAILEDPSEVSNAITGFAVVDNIFSGFGVYIFYLLLAGTIIGANIFIFTKYSSKEDNKKIAEVFKDAYQDLKPMPPDKRYLYLIHKAIDEVNQGKANTVILKKIAKHHHKTSDKVKAATGDMINSLQLEVELIYLKNIIRNVYDQINVNNLSKAEDFQIEADNVYLSLPTMFQEKIRTEYANMSAAIKMKLMAQVQQPKDKHNAFWERVQKNNNQMEYDQ